MYTSHYGLAAKPFSIVPDPSVLFLSETHENAITYLEYGLSEKVGFILLTGEVGIGKTTLIRHMLKKMPPQVDIAVIFNTNFSSDQLFRRILDEFDLPCDTTDKRVNVETLHHFLVQQFARGRHTLLIIDEAQNLSDAILEDIRMLFNLQTDNHILLQIMLVGQPDLKRRMNSSNLHQLAQRIVVNYHLTPLTDEQTYQYISYRLQAAGAKESLFSNDAMALIYKKSGGIPRIINLLCDAGLVYGYGDKKTLVDQEIIERVLKDTICLAVPAQEHPPATSAAAASALKAVDVVLSDRIAAIEAVLDDLQSTQKKFMQEIRAELDQTLQKIEAMSAEGGHTHQSDEERNDQATSYSFTDSADSHPMDGETYDYPHDALAAVDTDHQLGAEYTGLKPSPWKTFRKKIVPSIDMAYTFTKRTLLHRYVLWVMLLMIAFSGFWAMFERAKTSSTRHTLHQPMDSPPALELASINDDNLFPSLETGANQRNETAAPAEKGKTATLHTIQSGETLLSIAKHYKVPAHAIKKSNNLTNSHLIYVGQTLKIPLPRPAPK